MDLVTPVYTSGEASPSYWPVSREFGGGGGKTSRTLLCCFMNKTFLMKEASMTILSFTFTSKPHKRTNTQTIRHRAQPVQDKGVHPPSTAKVEGFSLCLQSSELSPCETFSHDTHRTVACSLFWREFVSFIRRIIITKTVIFSAGGGETCAWVVPFCRCWTNRPVTMQVQIFRATREGKSRYILVLSYNL